METVGQGGLSSGLRGIGCGEAESEGESTKKEEKKVEMNKKTKQE